MQPASKGQYTRVFGTAAGTTVIRTADANFERIILGQTKTGTVSFYDTGAATGTTSANFLGDFQNTVGSVPVSIEMGFRVKNGLTAVIGGTTDMIAVTS